MLRAIISETANASKTSSPIKTDIQLLSLLRKRASGSQTAADQFGQANRNDLKEKEEAEIAVLREYAESVQTTSDEEIRQAAEDAISALQAEGKRVDRGNVLKTLFAPEGNLHGKPAEKAEVARVVQSLLS